MKAEDRKELWESLGIVEDWLSAYRGPGAALAKRDPGWGGARSPRGEDPDFEAAAASAAERAAAARAARAAPAPERRPASAPPGAAPRQAPGASPPGVPAHPAGAPTDRVAAGLADGPRLPEPELRERLASLSRECSVCSACRLGAGRTKNVFGTGSLAPLVMAVGEGPGAEEDATGLPFVGPAGQLLDRMLGAIGLSREAEVYIANIVKCRPPMNRDPAPDERAACIGYLETQVGLLKPRYILALGRIAAQTLTGSSEGIGRLRGRWHEWRGIPVLATYHPSALLRDESYKRPAWEDLKLLKNRIEAEAAGGAEGDASAGAAASGGALGDAPDAGPAEAAGRPGAGAGLGVGPAAPGSPPPDAEA